MHTCKICVIQVYYDKMQNGDEYVGTAEVSTSTIVSNAGQVIKEWVKLSRGKEEVGQVLLEFSFSRNMFTGGPPTVGDCQPGNAGENKMCSVSSMTRRRSSLKLLKAKHKRGSSSMSSIADLVTNDQEALEQKMQEIKKAQEMLLSREAQIEKRAAELKQLEMQLQVRMKRHTHI